MDQTIATANVAHIREVGHRLAMIECRRMTVYIAQLFNLQCGVCRNPCARHYGGGATERYLVVALQGCPRQRFCETVHPTPWLMVPETAASFRSRVEPC
jgi:hypothetical protein